MKIGDKVKVTRLDNNDKSQTQLVIGDIGIIEDEDTDNQGDEWDIFFVRFTKDINESAVNLNEDGTYQMRFIQLEVIEAAP